MKNYYLILGVDLDATQEEIRAAYRHQAKDLHPDLSGQDSRPFIDLQEAYAILSDPARRRTYDRTIGRTQVPSPREAKSEPLIPKHDQVEPLIPPEDPIDLGDLSLSSSFRTTRPSFDELFGRLWRNFGPDRPEFERLRRLSVEIRIHPQDALRGGRVRLLVPARLYCQTCGGRGGIGFFECWRCEGSGVVHSEYPLSLSFPAGIIDGHVVEIPLERFGISNFYLRVIFRVSENR